MNFASAIKILHSKLNEKVEREFLYIKIFCKVITLTVFICNIAYAHVVKLQSSFRMKLHAISCNRIFVCGSKVHRCARNVWYRFYRNDVFNKQIHIDHITYCSFYTFYLETILSRLEGLRICYSHPKSNATSPMKVHVIIACMEAR